MCSETGKGGFKKTLTDLKDHVVLQNVFASISNPYLRKFNIYSLFFCFLEVLFLFKLPHVPVVEEVNAGETTSYSNRAIIVLRI